MSNVRKKSETSAMLENTNNIMVVKRQQSKPCNVSQVNQTTDRDDKAHDAIAL